MFLQDGDPSQNSKAAKTTLDKIGAVQFTIPLRSPDLHPIENAFNLVEIKSNSVQSNIPFPKRVMQSLGKELKTVLSYPIVPIDNIIKPMLKIVSQVIQGYLLKY